MIGPGASAPLPVDQIIEKAPIAVASGAIVVAAIITDTLAHLRRANAFSNGFLAVLGISTLSAFIGLWMLRRTMLSERALSEMKTNFIAKCHA